MHQPDLYVHAANVQLAVYTWGERPTLEQPREVLVLAHGFPDRALFWEKVAKALERDFYVVAYDMRGCARSTHISGTRHYRYEVLVADLLAVIDAVSPTQKVHLVGHDWGGLYGWEAIVDPAGMQRIASFTTLSPSLEQVGFYLRSRLLRPTPRNLWQLGSQLLRNSLMTFFTLPVLPELLFLSGMGTFMFKRLVTRFEPRISFQDYPGLAGDARRYLGIYRANLLQRTLRPRKVQSIVPVHAIIAVHDPFLPPPVFERSHEWTVKYSQSLVDAAHWAPLSRPLELATDIAVFVGLHRQAERVPSAVTISTEELISTGA